MSLLWTRLYMLLCFHYVILSGCSHFKHNDITYFWCCYVYVVMSLCRYVELGLRRHSLNFKWREHIKMLLISPTLCVCVQNASNYGRFVLAREGFFGPAFLLRVFTTTVFRFLPILIKGISYTVNSNEVTCQRKPFQLFHTFSLMFTVLTPNQESVEINLGR